jgi:predicted nucleotidyltransferase
LFGSAARGEFSPNSDADFLIIKRDTPLYGADRIRELSFLIDRAIALDLLVYRPEEIEERINLGDPFLKAISPPLPNELGHGIRFHFLLPAL